MTGTAFATTAHALLANADKIAGEKADGTKGHFTGAVLRAGTTTNDDAPAGQIGEPRSSSIIEANAVTLTTGVSANVTSISLTAGDWDVYGQVGFRPGASTSVTELLAAINTTSAAAPNAEAIGGARDHRVFPAHVTGAVVQSIPTGTARISLATPTTVYLIAYSVFTVSTQKAWGKIFARRAS